MWTIAVDKLFLQYAMCIFQFAYLKKQSCQVCKLMTKKIYLGHAMLQQKRKNNYVGVDKKRKHGNLKREGVEIELKWGRANDARR